MKIRFIFEIKNQYIYRIEFFSDDSEKIHKKSTTEISVDTNVLTGIFFIDTVINALFYLIKPHFIYTFHDWVFKVITYIQ